MNARVIANLFMIYSLIDCLLPLPTQLLSTSYTSWTPVWLKLLEISKVYTPKINPIESYLVLAICPTVLKAQARSPGLSSLCTKVER
jgi:hypothetical protein